MEDRMARPDDAEASDDLERVVREAIGQGGIESAVIFAVRPDASELELVAAAGIEGPPLERLATAVQNAAHPIRRAVSDDGPTFDVQPTAPGGPALRSHLPVVTRRDGRPTVVGVLAVAHQLSLDPGPRGVLERLADEAESLLAPTATKGTDEEEHGRGNVG
jgi:hypothetical protein